MDSFRFQYFFIFLLLNFFEIVQQDKVYSIKGPKHINGSIGEDALFMWNTTDQKEILAVSWGIRKGNLPDPQFISVYSLNGNRRVNINEDIGDTLKRRVEFLGNLTIGRAWFVLKNLTVNDTNEYIASISADVSVVQLYHVSLMVAEKDKVLCQITGPTELYYSVGENAQFRWNTVSNSAILSATWGINKGNIADPQFINVDITSTKVNMNLGLDPDLIKRLSFDGDLKRGRAWFTLKNVTVEDTNVYLASISDDVTRVLPYKVELTVKAGNIETTKRIGHSRFPEIARKRPTKVTETEIHTPKDPKGPANSNDYNLPTIITVLLASLGLVLVLVIISAFLYRHKRKSPKKNRDTNSSENKLMGATVHI